MATIEKSTTKFQPADWHTNNFALSTNSERQIEASHEIRQESRWLRNETNVQTKWDQYDNETRLADRIDNIRDWKDQLVYDHDCIDAEIKKLNEAKDQMEKKLEQLNLPQEVVNDCLTTRDTRRDIDQVEDEIERQLKKEQEIIRKIKEKRQQKIDEAFEQLCVLNEARAQIMKDVQDKSEAMDIDIDQYKLTEKSPKISFKVDPKKVLKGSTTPQQWDDFSRYNHQRAMAEINASKRLREAMHQTVHSTDNDLAGEKKASDFALRKRIREFEKALDELKWQKKNLEDEISALETDLDGIELSIRAKIPTAKLAETRLENRKERPGIDLCRDAAQYALVDEVNQIKATKEALLEKQRQSRHALDALMKQLHRVNDDIALKEFSLGLDKKCDQIRQRLGNPDASTLQETNLLSVGITNDASKVLA